MIKVLIVEDEKPIANLIRLSLNKEGYACTCAFDGLAAVDLNISDHWKFPSSSSLLKIQFWIRLRAYALVLKIIL